MVFGSHVFVYYFLPAALLVYYALPLRARHLWLTLASYAFYGWANPAFMGMMLLSTEIDFVCGRRLGQAAPEAQDASPRRAPGGTVTVADRQRATEACSPSRPWQTAHRT